MSVSWDNVYKLLNIVHDSRDLPTLKPLNNLAMWELQEQSKIAEEDLAKAMAEEADKKAKAEEELRAKQEALAKKEQEAVGEQKERADA